MRVKSLELLNVKSYENVEIEFSKGINLLIGANNSGKSTIIKSLMNLQYHTTFDRRDIRSQEISAKIQTKVVDVNEKDFLSFYNPRVPQELEPASSFNILWHLGLTPANTVVEENLYFNSRHKSNIISSNQSGKSIRKKVHFKQFARFPDSENSNNFIFPFLAKRKTEYYDSNINHEQSLKILEGLRNLAGRIQRIDSSSHPRNKEFISLCEDILGFRIGVVPIDQQNANGHELGMYVTNTSVIPIKYMGDGVVNIVGFIATLLTEDSKLYLVEELENDIHPKALKKLLSLIKEKSLNNQFVISTHSHIVLKYLGIIPDSKIFFIENIADQKTIKIPTSKITEIENKPELRIEILEKLGYDFQDFELHEAYLILEESSAETVIRDFLIPNIVPDLYNRIKTIGAKGVDDLHVRVIDFNRLFVFIHTNPIYFKKAWVVADGDEVGLSCILKLQAEFKSWPQNHFKNFTKYNFEEFYPARFKKKAESALKLKGNEKREAKRQLLNEVMSWALKNREEAIEEFSSSASEVIELLNTILKSFKTK